MKQQTAVDWLKDKIQNGIMCDHINGVEYWNKETLLEFIEQTKEMENEREYEIKAFWFGRGINAGRENKIIELKPTKK